jgi:hypothetical protein
MNSKDIYYATEKDIFDLLASKRKHFTKDVLLELCKDRGIICSNDEDKDRLIEYISILPYAYQDLASLLDQVQINTRGDKKISTKIDIPFNVSLIQNAVNKIKEVRGEEKKEVFSVVAESDSKIVVDVSYTELDYGATRLKQRVDRNDRIEIIKNDDGGIYLRLPSNERMQELKNVVALSVIGESTDVKPKEINLSGVRIPEARTKFFLTLIQSTNGLKLHDVSSIKVAAISDQAIEEIEDDGDDIDIIQQEIVGKLQNAILQGSDLLKTIEYKSLIDKGFYICSIIWNTVDNNHDKYQFEASFSDTENCNNFVYSLRGVYKWKEDKYTSTRRAIEGLEKNELLRTVEKAAEESFDKIVREYCS